MVNACFEAGNIGVLVETIVALGKKRSVVKQAITGMVQRCMEFVEGMVENTAEKFKLINGIREVTEGKIFVEIERARITKKLAAIREGEGKIVEAAELMQELQVETFGSMDRKERIDFILEQLRLLLTCGQHSKAQIISRKIQPKVFEIAELADLKLRWLSLMLQLALTDGKYKECSEYHYQLYQSTKKVEDLANATVLAVMAKNDCEQTTLLNTLNNIREIEEVLPASKALLRLFLTRELIRWPQVDALFSSQLKDCYVFADASSSTKRIADFKDRVVEHNIRVISGCFKSIHLARLASLLDLPVPEAEEYLCKLIISDMVKGKIDRIAGTVLFKSPQSPEETLNGWANQTDTLLSLMVRTNHAISKELMMTMK